MRTRGPLQFIVGPRTFSWQSAAWLSIVSTVGSYGPNVVPGNNNPELLSAVLLAATTVAVSIYAIFAAGFQLLTVKRFQLLYVVFGFAAILLIRAYVSDTLLLNWDLATESRLGWRIQRTFIFGMAYFISIAILMNFIHDKKQQQATLREDLQDEIRNFNDKISQVSDQRIFTIHEMSIECATTQELLSELNEQLPKAVQSHSAFVSLVKDVEYVSDVLARARQINPMRNVDAVQIPKPTWMDENSPFSFSYRNQLQSMLQDITLRRKEVEEMFDRENRMWKRAFVSDISQSPTAATALLRQVAENPTADSVPTTIARIADIWKMIVHETVTSVAYSSRLQTSGRLEP